MRGGRRTWLALGVLLFVTLGAWIARTLPGDGGASSPDPAMSAQQGLAAVVDHLLACRRGASSPGLAPESDDDSAYPPCTGVVYLWSDLMPLSREGLAQIRIATERLDTHLTVVDAHELESRAAGLFPSAVATSLGTLAPSEADAVVAEFLAAGATLHQPSLLVIREGRLLGGAILGYKTAEAYEAVVRERLATGDGTAAGGPTGGGAMAAPGTTPLIEATAGGDLATEWSRDFQVQGRPGAYFRSVPGRQALAFESNGRVYLLDLVGGGTVLAPGYIDFVPSPDGKLFVTPGRGRRGLAFYQVDEVFEAAARGAGPSVDPVYVDPQMQDQYPSVGILSSAQEDESTKVVYRVLTSWFDRIAYRDYEVLTPDSGKADVRPLGDPVVACPQVSIPILSPDGMELAGRDEASATTQLFRLQDGCRAVADLGVQSGKVAWSSDGRRLAFAIPRGAVRDGSRTVWVGANDPAQVGIFVYYRDGGRVERVAGSERALRLAFPEFVGPDSLAFQLTPAQPRDESVFRLICCVR